MELHNSERQFRFIGVKSLHENLAKALRSLTVNMKCILLSLEQSECSYTGSAASIKNNNKFIISVKEEIR